MATIHRSLQTLQSHQMYWLQSSCELNSRQTDKAPVTLKTAWFSLLWIIFLYWTYLTVRPTVWIVSRNEWKPNFPRPRSASVCWLAHRKWWCKDHVVYLWCSVVITEENGGCSLVRFRFGHRNSFMSVGSVGQKHICLLNVFLLTWYDIRRLLYMYKVTQQTPCRTI